MTELTKKPKREARYVVKIAVTASNVNALKSKLEKAGLTEYLVAVEKVDLNPSRSSRLSDAEQLVEESKSIVEELKDEMDSWYENMPENFQNGDKGSAVQEAVEALDNILTDLENLDFSSVEFPGMMG